jgi:hypothetical protein
MALPAIPSIVATNQYYQLALQALYALSGQGPNPSGVNLSVPSTPVNGQQTTTSSAAALPSNTVTTGVIVTNTGATNAVYIGNSGLTSGNGYSLAPGASVGLVVSNTNSIYVLNGSGGSSTVSFIGS